MTAAPRMPEYLLEEYLYHHLQILSVDFLPQDKEAQRQLEMLGRIEWILASSSDEQRAKWIGQLNPKFAAEEAVRKRFSHGAREERGPALPPISSRTVDPRHPLRVDFSTRAAYSQWLRRSVLYTNWVAQQAKEDLTDVVGYLGEALRQQIEGSDVGALRVRDGHISAYTALRSAGTVTFRATDGRFLDTVVVPALSEKGRVLIPFSNVFNFTTSRMREEPVFTIYPYRERQLYNCAALVQRKGSVIITDSLEIALRNNLFSGANIALPFIWTSWYGGSEHVANVDWEPLRGRNLYYHVLDHSGHSMSEACDAAREIADAVKKELGEDIRFIVQTEPPEILRGFPSVRSRVPAILDRNEFDIYSGHSSPAATWVYPGPSGTPKADKILRKRVRIFDPIVSTGTTTLIYGASGVGKSWLALGIAKATWLGKSLVGEWEGKKPTNVLYLNTPPELVRCDEKLEALFGSDPRSYVSDSDPWIEWHWHGRFSHGTGFSVAGVHPELLWCPEPACSEWFSKHAPAMSDGPSMLVIDGLEWLDPVHPAPFAGIRTAIRNVAANGGAVVVVVSTLDGSQKWTRKLRNSFPFDSIVKVDQRTAQDASEVGLSVRIAKGFGLCSSRSTTLKLDLAPETGGWRRIYTKRLPLAELKLVAKCMEEGMKGRDTAEKLDISLPQVNKRKRELRGRTKLPAEILKNPKALRKAQALVAKYTMV